jgi:hypothetical protein
MITFTHKINRFAVKVAAYTGGFGIFQALLIAVSNNELLMIFACVYVLLALIVHALIFLSVLVHCIKYYKQLQEHLISLFILLLNIPLAWLCAFLILEL